MSAPAVLTFLPWMRRGLVRSLAGAADKDGVPTATLGTIEAAVTVGATEVVTAIQIRGPGSVLGLMPGQVIRQEPPDGTVDFETNYFPFVELLSPDLPWMFTPAAPQAQRLMPWLVLVVVEEREGVSLAARAGAPVPVLAIDDAARELPSLREAWAWAHVQASVELGSDVDAAFTEQPEAFVARLLCPRRLTEDTHYLACVVPSFEPGRLAGLGLPVTADAPPALAWSATTGSIDLPVYTSWRFRTARAPGDFESLVKRLKARTLQGSVGVHDLDIGDPGSERLPLAPGTLVGFTGALVSPTVTLPVWPSGHKRTFQSALRTMLNEMLAAESSTAADARPYDAQRDDPVVAPPAYGALPAGLDEVPAVDAVSTAQAPTWLSEANLDPVHRSAAGLGAEVVRNNQEALVATAWDQAAALRQVNRVLNRTRLALEVGQRLKLRVDALADGALLQLTSPAHAQLKNTGMALSLEGRLAQSALPDGLFSGAFRRRLRPGTSLARASASTGAATLTAELTQQFVNDPAAMLAFAAFTVPSGTVFTEDKVEKTGTVVSAVQSLDLDAAFGMGTGDAVPRALDSRAELTRPGLSLEGRTSVPIANATKIRTKRAIGRAAARVATRRRAAPSSSLPSDLGVGRAEVLVSPMSDVIDAGGPGALPITESAALVRDKLDPTALLQVRVRALVTAPASAWTSAPVPSQMGFTPAYADPLYELLVKIDPELLLPGVGAIPNDTVALSRMNPAFVEAFLLGANHELGREFMWREVPIDPADTWLKTFWDPVGAAVEDIAAVNDWSKGPLGSHQPAGGIDPEQVLVLLVKGDLLRRYPSTLIYTVPSLWKQDATTGQWERVEDEGATPLHPIFVGALGRDVVFLGFQFAPAIDVDRDVAGSAVEKGPHPGWFFVFEQPPTEPRFGLDVGRAAQTGKKPELWRNVSWFHALGAEQAASHVPLAPLDDGVARAYDSRGENDWTEVWAKDAAGMARVTLQRPVRMLVHADQMLGPTGGG